MTTTENRARRTRALAIPGTEVGRRRQELYKGAYARINDAMAAGYYLEAIALTESLLSDRLESRASYLRGRDFGFRTLGDLIKEHRRIENDATLKTMVVGEVGQWAKARNTALHEIAKLAAGDARTWSERIAELAPTAKQGLALLRRLNEHVRKLKKVPRGTT